MKLKTIIFLLVAGLMGPNLTAQPSNQSMGEVLTLLEKLNAQYDDFTNPNTINIIANDLEIVISILNRNSENGFNKDIAQRSSTERIKYCLGKLIELANNNNNQILVVFEAALLAKFGPNFIDGETPNLESYLKISPMLMDPPPSELGFINRKFNSPTSNNLAGGFAMMATDALAGYIAERVKEEIALEITEKLIKRFKSDKTPFKEMAVLLPKTAELLQNLTAADIIGLPELLRQNVKTDLGNLLENSPKLLTISPYKGLVERYPELVFAFNGLKFVKSLSTFKHPSEILPLLQASAIFNNPNFTPNQKLKIKKIKDIIEIMQILNSSLTVNETENASWISGKDLESYLFSDPFFTVVWFGLLEQKIKKFYPENKIAKKMGNDIVTAVKASLLNGLSIPNLQLNTLQAQINTNWPKVQNLKETIRFFRTDVTNLVYQAEALSSKLNDLSESKKAGGKTKAEVIYAYSEESLNFLDTLLNTLAKFYDLRTGHDENGNFLTGIHNVRKYIATARIGLSVYKSIEDKHYAQAAITLLQLLPRETAKVPVASLISGFEYRMQEMGNISAIANQSGGGTPNPEQLDALTATLNLISEYGLDDKNEIKKVTKLVNKYQKTQLDADLNELKDNLINANLYKNYFLKEFDEGCTKLLGLPNQHPSWFKSLSPDEIQSYNIFIRAIQLAALQTIFYGGINYTQSIQEIKAHFNDLRIIEIIEKIAFQAIGTDMANTNSEALRYLSFFSSMTTATNTDEMKAAYKTLFEPVGSWSVKRHDKFNISLNAYPGLWGGFNGSLLSHAPSRKQSYSITAPVGLSFSKGNNSKAARPGCWTAYLSIIDIGAITEFRFKNDSTVQLPAFGLGNILAPGFYIMRGFANTGINLAMGGQYGPGLSSINAQSTQVLENTWRFGFSLTYDIPLLKLYSKHRD